jgi:hypothetical protein
MLAQAPDRSVRVRRSTQRLRWAITGCAAIGVLTAARLVRTYWFGSGNIFLRVKSSVWVALAWAFAHGEFYRPVLGPSGYGGTRYMPLLFVIHGLLIRAGADPIRSGLTVMQLSVVAAAAALFVALRTFEVDTKLAAPLAALVWCTVILQQSATDLNPDYLAATLVLSGSVIALVDGSAVSRFRLIGASAVLVAASMVKITAIAFAVPVVAMLWRDRRADAAWFGGATAALFASTVAAIDVVSSGRFHESFLSAASATSADTWRALPKFAWEVAIKPFDVALPFALACWCVVRNPRRSWTAAYLASTVAVSIVIFAWPGTASNHLVDLHLASVLVIGVALARGELSERVGVAAFGALAAMLIVTSVPVRGVPSVAADVRAALPRPRDTARTMHAEFLSNGPYLSIDPIVPVLNDERPWLIDYGTLEHFSEANTPAGRDLARRVREHFFAAIVLPGSDGFARDMDRGDRGFAEAEAKYWADYESPLAGLLRSTYTLRAARRPFVILVPSRH